MVGGGLVGAATAYHLARHGASVVLLEQGQLNQGASGQNAGSLHFQLEHRMVEHGEDLARQFALALPLSVASQSEWARLPRQLGDDSLEIAQHGGLMVAETAEQMQMLDRKHELEREGGLVTELLDGEQSRAIAPYLSERIVGAGWCAQEGHANARAVTLAFARAAARAGAEIRTCARVSSLERQAGRWDLRVSDGTRLSAGTRVPADSGVSAGAGVSARSVLIAAGVWSGRVAALADVRLPVTPIALTMLVTAPAKPLVGHLVQHVAARLSLKQASAGNLLIGGGWPARLAQRGGVVDLDSRPQPRLDSISGSVRIAARIVPFAASKLVIRCWTGTTALTPDGALLIGEIPRRPGLFVGAGSSAFTNGPLFGRHLADMILGRSQSLDLSPYSPARYGHLNFA
ncbi:MAG: NAD(P)/FAD-dependent oxidoreductase [Solirubrobacteraceae bacterium]